MSSDHIEVFNMKENGADNTGIVDCSKILDIAQASGKVIYFPKGTYHIKYWRPDYLKGEVHMLGDGAENTIIKVDSIMRPYNNWIVEDIQFVASKLAPPGTFGIDPDSQGNTHDFTMNRCICTTERITDTNMLHINVIGCKTLRVTDSKFLYGCLQIINCNYLMLKDNYFDTYYINNNEQIHAGLNCSGVISGNHMYNSNLEFFDVYSSGRSIIIENNKCVGFNGAVAEIKVIFRDAGAEYGGSNITGAWENIIVRNNQFSGGYSGNLGMFNLTTLDYRNAPVVNDYQYYGRYLIIEGNYIDDTKLDSTANPPTDSSLRTIFSITGLSNINFLNNTIVMNYGFKTIFHFATFGNSTLKTSQLTKNVRIEGNTIVLKHGYNSTKEIYVVTGGNIDGLIVKNNTFPYFSRVLNNTDYPITNAIFESNLFDNINDETLSSSFRHAWIQIGGSNIIFRDMSFWGFITSTTFGNSLSLNLDFINCTFVSTVLLNNGDTIRFIGCKIKGTQILFQSAVSLLYILDCIFTSYSWYYLDGGMNVTKYIARGIYTDTKRPSLWNGTVPTKTDFSAKY